LGDEYVEEVIGIETIFFDDQSIEVHNVDLLKNARLEETLLLPAVSHYELLLACLNQGCSEIEEFFTAMHYLSSVLLSPWEVLEH
jgi:hypothetical protein